MEFGLHSILTFAKHQIKPLVMFVTFSMYRKMMDAFPERDVRGNIPSVVALTYERWKGVDPRRPKFPFLEKIHREVLPAVITFSQNRGQENTARPATQLSMHAVQSGSREQWQLLLLH